MTNALGDTCLTKLLMAETLGTPSKHVQTAYIDNIIPHPSLATPNLQNVTTEGNTTDTDIVMSLGNLEVTAGHVEAGGHVHAVTNIVTTTGNIEAQLGDIHTLAGDIISAGKVQAATNITATTGDIKTLAGDIDSSGTLTAGTGITSTTGDITASSGKVLASHCETTGHMEAGTHVQAGSHVIATTYVKADTNITATTGDIKTLAGDIVSAGSLTSGTGITSTSGDIECSAGDIRAPSGGFSCGSSSLLNRLRYNTDYGMYLGNPTSYLNPYQLSGFGIWNPVTIPAGYYNCVLFCKGNPTQTQYQFEFTTSYLDVLKDYTIKVHLQPAYDPTSSNNTGVQEVRIGYMSPNSYQFKVQVDSSVAYATNQILKFSFHLEYSPSP